MILDIILAIVVLVWAVYGYRKGFVRQIFVLAGIIAIVFAAAPMADIVQNILSKEFDLQLTGRYVRSFLLAGCSAILYILMYIIGRFLQATLIKGIPVAEKTNHILGTVLSILASALAIYFILALCAIGNEKIKEYAPAVHNFISSSKCYQITESHNPIQNFDFFKDIKHHEPSQNTPNPEGRDAPQPTSEIQPSTDNTASTNPADDTPTRRRRTVKSTEESVNNP